MERLQHPYHRQMFDYWRGKFREDAPPTREDIDPTEIPPAILPWLILYSVDWRTGLPRFRFRLVGTGIVQRYNRDVTGKYFEDAYDDKTLARQIDSFSDVAVNGRPAYARLQVPVPDRDFISYERLLLPLGGAEEKVGGIVAVMAFAPH